ncbi:LysM peptidoglycan-binding domain-containing protein [Weissella minor]|uniref:CAP domain-containing protein n=1 Tax=Weissella minor TaxID=1620 RepID=UPI001BAE854C|nr:CAP domain-containing protein [Weissella minor]MBS0949772.1 LysM peptidoglycan-binding domain-containing protein [Weissella minor]
MNENTLKQLGKSTILASSLLAAGVFANQTNASASEAQNGWTANSVAQVSQAVQQSAGNDYLIRYGDTLWALSQATNSSIAHLAQTNGIANPDLIYAGTTMTLSDGAIARPVAQAVPDEQTQVDTEAQPVEQTQVANQAQPTDQAQADTAEQDQAAADQAEAEANAAAEQARQAEEEANQLAAQKAEEEAEAQRVAEAQAKQDAKIKAQATEAAEAQKREVANQARQEAQQKQAEAQEKQVEAQQKQVQQESASDQQNNQAPVTPNNSTDDSSNNNPAPQSGDATFTALNELRAANGLAPLQWDADLAAQATARASLVNSTQSVPNDHWSTAGEVIAIGWNAGSDVNNAWFNEINMTGAPGHRNWQMNANYTHVGFGHVGNSIVGLAY